MTLRSKSIAIFFVAFTAIAVAFWQDSGRQVGAETPSRPENYTDKIEGEDVEFEMVGVPGGTFMMGSPIAEAGRDANEGPQRPVTVKAFWLGKTEVSWETFDLFQSEMGVDEPKENEKRLKEDPDAITGPTPPYVDKNYGHPHKGHPAICMTHHAAMEYCRWLSKKTGKVYRLPTEAEWEYACRAGSTTAFSHGNDPKQLKDYAWYKENSPTLKKIYGGTHKVGALKPNAWGLHDMHGNVMEWCLDHYQKDTYSKFSKDMPTLQPVILPTARRWAHVTRGGNWSDDPEQCRSATRRPSDPSWMQHDPNEPKSIWWLTKIDIVGFRVARAVDEQNELKNLRSKVTRKSD